MLQVTVRVELSKSLTWCQTWCFPDARFGSATGLVNRQSSMHISSDVLTCFASKASKYKVLPIIRILVLNDRPEPSVDEADFQAGRLQVPWRTASYRRSKGSKL
ncbi:hypothetical protein RIB2604_03701620 [Aspergillus luchuensis]|uniref:Uncharacterized protein n=1 Tax=Aspergillus kawachii TaxID=1069201 RepID=A0A146G220_ASPKA|nr:hypothetical protein RIB2604_03701620 [Aspergillus luchuensis]